MRRALFLLFAACHPDPLGEGTPSLLILTPADGEVVCGDPLAISIEVENFELVDLTTEDKPGTGHVDVSLNGQIVNMTDETSFELPEVAAGEYRLQIDLVNADHTPIEPYTGQTVYFEVDPAACGG